MKIGDPKRNRSPFFSQCSFLWSSYSPTFTLKCGQGRGQRNYNYFIVRNILTYSKDTTPPNQKDLKHKDNPFTEKWRQKEAWEFCQLKILLVFIYIFGWTNNNNLVKYTDKGFFMSRSLTSWIMLIYKENFKYTGFKKFFKLQKPFFQTNLI